MDDLTDKVFSKIEEKFELQSLESLPAVARNIVVIVSAQGVIDNGGHEYFFGSDWPDTPPYSIFISAYRAIGCNSQADDFERVATSFPFDNPHLYEDLRKKYIEENYDEENFEVKGWREKLCGDKDVWQKLEAYIIIHKAELEAMLKEVLYLPT